MPEETGAGSGTGTVSERMACSSMSEPSPPITPMLCAAVGPIAMQDWCRNVELICR